MADGKVGPVSKKIIEFVRANPGIHAGEIARRLGKGRGGSARETIRHLIEDGYLAKGEKRRAPTAKGHAVHPLKYTGKSYEGGYEFTTSKRAARIQQRIAEEREQQAQLNESIVWAGKVIRAMVQCAQVAT
ncbi:winged helix-turn-helix domain-containing protein [Burkholderia seminalis]|uniref:winged helix-turn-helix domain-containing protein n=1 Tax=Burkholderia seminalis TaxID=488731 RepID=UPI000F5B75A9|nr:winged helix-turn-helix domain-containing protein [Burkholderia seminalis]RQS85153.1 winged helix-turn-helix domain-containing protein [Burkholderia seminalis]